MFAAERVSLWCQARVGLLWGGGSLGCSELPSAWKVQRPALPSGGSRLWLAGSWISGTALSLRPLGLVFGLRRKHPLERAPPGLAWGWGSRSRKGGAGS